MSAGVCLIVVLCACGESPGELDGATELDAGPVDCGGDDALDVLVVEPRWGAGEDRPVVGAVVMADCDAGRIVAVTDADGIARIEGLALERDTVDVSAWAPDLAAMRTRIAVGPEGLGSPFRIPMRHYRNHGLATETVRGSIEHSADGRVALCSITSSAVAGGRTREHRLTGGSYELTWIRDLAVSARVTCLELTVIDAQSVRVEAFAEAEVVPGEAGPTISFAGAASSIERREITLALHDSFAAVTGVEASVLDAEPELGALIGTLESYEIGADGTLTLRVAHAVDVTAGEPVIRARILANGGEPAYVYRGPLAALVDPIAVPPAPTMTVDLSTREALATDAAWADDYGVYLGYALQPPRWLITAPATVTQFRVPDPPPGVTDVDVLGLVGWRAWFFGSRYVDVAPPPDNFNTEFWNANVRDTVFHNVTGR